MTAERPENVRIANPADEARLYVLLLKMHKEPIAHDIPVSPTRVIDQIKLATEHGAGVIGVIDGDIGDIAASVGIFLNRWWWSETPYHQMLWTFIRPEYRGRINPADLFRFSKWAETAAQEAFRAQGHEFRLITEGAHAAGERLAARDRLWRRFGKRVGSVFLMD